MSHVLRLALVLTVSALAGARPAAAADYLFAVPELQMQVWVHRDASVRIVYDITFHNNRRGHPIDIVDIGVPHRGYDLGQVQATMGGSRLTDIRRSEVVSPGFEVHLDAETIPPGRQGTLHVEFPMRDMVWQDTTRRDYASLQVVPVWFGPQYVTGTTRLQVAIHLPPSVKPDEALFQNEPFTYKARVKMAEPGGGAAEEHTVVAWEREQPLVRAYKFGVSFPKRDLARVVYLTPFGLAMKWFRESVEARVIAGIAFLAMFAFLFFRFSGGTGFSVFVILSGGAVLLFAISPEMHLLSFPVVVLLISLNEWMLGRRKTGYMPPIASIEGGGIKRGLTAPEAAAILEMPLSKVLGLVIFGLLKKGILRQIKADPLVVEVDEAFRVPDDTLAAGRPKFYREAAQARSTVLHGYEPAFLRAIQIRSGTPAREIDFSTPLKELLTQTAARLKGFDLGQTRDYYRAIVRRAAEQAGSIADIPQREKQIDRNFEWILLDPRFPDVFDYGRPYRPVWTRGGAYTSGGGGTSSGPSAPSAPSMPGQTTFGEVAASFSGWAENTMGGLASAIGPASLNIPRPQGGFLDLSGADHVTGELFKALAEASAKGGRSGGGGGCACACAGCACACACAGGGR
jgi:hypothetical protein